LKHAFLNRRFLIITFHLLLFSFIAYVSYSHTDKVNAVKQPPSSLAQWYKPENKRQVWLHNMFKLRREMQAVEFYAGEQDIDHLNKWATRLGEHYLKIGEMVPEWQGLLNNDALSALLEKVNQNQFQAIPAALKNLSENCNSCHADYQSTTAALYRAPNFKGMMINTSTPYTQHMDTLSKQVNQVKIASEDGMAGLALSSLSDLKSGIQSLGETCESCHKDGSEIYPNETISLTMEQLEQSFKTGTLKDQGRHLGTLAVLACARCHSTHRIAYDARKQLSEEMDWQRLITH